MKNALMRLALVAVVLLPGNSTAQEAAPQPTPQEVLEELGQGHVEGTTNAVAILTQLHERRPRSELNAFADGLVALAVEGYEDNRPGAWLAWRALVSSASPEEPDAVPYARELGVELGPYCLHYCLHKYHDYQYRDVLAQLREGEAKGAERAVDILTGRAEGYPVYITILADSLSEMAVSGGGTSVVARRALAVLERSAHPAHADAKPFAHAYLYIDIVFQVTESQAALESLVEIDAARARALLTELAQRDQAVACKARAVLAGTADGPRVLRDLEGRGVLTYRCGP